MKHYRRTGLVLASLTILASGNAYAQKWNYLTYDASGPGSMGQISLEERGGEAEFRMQAVALDSCYRSALKATVERTESTITITPTPRMGGCEKIRFVLNADGSGGYREILNSDSWVREKRDRVLTLRK
ncbi:hypothetical protein [Ramlibacter sp. AN1133]|uniref:hypothetical protein n=1 Tax=Ramlibacter sp. AN1133 TaxID=3133429 RepID=UPI0030BBCA1B